MTVAVDKQGVLRARAQALARGRPAQAVEPAVEIVEFSLAAERYGIETAYVREVLVLKELTPVPCTPAFVAGIVNVRGRMVTAVDLKQFFDLPLSGLHDLHKVIVLQAEELELGVLADDVVGVRRVPLSQLQPALPTLTGIRAAYLRGVTGERLALLDGGKLLADPKLTVNEEVA